MKRTALIIFAALIALFLCACFAASPEAPGASSPSAGGGDTASPSSDTGGNEADIELTLPVSIVEAGMSEELSEEDIAGGIKSKRINGDGSLTLTMGKSDYEKLLADMRRDFGAAIDALVTDDNYPSIKDVEYTEDFSEITLTVDKNSFESGFERFALFSVGMQGTVYQIFSGVAEENLRVAINLRDAATSEIYSTDVFPDSSGT